MTILNRCIERVRAWWKGFGRPPRVMGVDVARALAIIGMMGAHLANAPDLVWGDPSTWLGVMVGRPSALFGLLAGVSVSLVTGRTTPLPPEQVRTARERLVARGVVVFAIGIVLVFFFTPIGIILPLYGVLFGVATVFLRWSALRLFVVGGAVALVGPPTMAFLMPLSMEAFVILMNGLTFGPYPVVAWMAYLFIGMGVGRLRIDTAKTAAILLGAGIVLAFASYGIASFLPHDHDGGPYYRKELSWSASGANVLVAMTNADPHSGGVLDILGSSGFALAVLGLCLLVARPLRWVLLPLAAFGSMPLTAYAAHVISVAFLGGAMEGEMPVGRDVWLWSCVAIGVGALLWANVFGKGPLERLVAKAATAAARDPGDPQRP